ncbi:MAG TPA: 2'-5' RNA ligase, partial [Janibacter terrae]|nr:2'-5' RNA ligase [Janibacter terrae]
YHPHVTIAHHVDESALDQAFDGLAGFDARFEVGEIHLYQHGADGVWRPMQGFRLSGTRLQPSS